MVKVKKVIWISEPDSEARVELTDGELNIICFCYPCELYEGQELSKTISAFEATHVMRNSEKTFHVEKLYGAFNYHLVGQLISKSQGLVVVGGFLIEVGKDLIPKDIAQGEFVEFRCVRLDI